LIQWIVFVYLVKEKINRMKSTYYVVKNESFGVDCICSSNELVDMINSGYKPVSSHDSYSEAVSQYFI